MTTTQCCIVIAHRGASRVVRENTLEAFTHARVLGADMVELDARRTRDGVVVVHHDAHLPDGRALVACDSSSLPPHVPTLAAALATCAPMHVNVEIKNGVGEPDHDPHGEHLAAVLAVLDDAIGAGTPPHALLVSSFDRATLVRTRVRAPYLATALLTYERIDAHALVQHAVDEGHAALHPFDPTVDATLVDLAHAAGLAVHVWTVDDEARIAALVALGIDGVCTNVPDVARRVLDERGGARPATAR